MKKTLLSAFAALLMGGAVSAQTIHYSEDFENGLPDGWVLEDEWAHGASSDLSSAYFNLGGNPSNIIAFNDDGAGQTHVGGGRAISAPIDLTAVAAPLFLEVNMFFTNSDFQGADETIKLFASTDEGASWSELKDFAGVDWDFELLSVDQLAGQTVMLAFEYQDGSAWNFGVGIDDISFSDVPVNAVRRNYALTIDGGAMMSQCAKNIEYQAKGMVFNNGYEPINSFDISVTSAAGTELLSFSDLNIEKGQGMRYELPETINTGESPSAHLLQITNVNGEMDADENTDDNGGTIAFSPIDVHPDKAVVVEEATGTWCQWCPRGTVFLDEMSKRFGHSFVGIAVHNGANDPMVLPAYDNAITGFSGFSGFPSVIYNREEILDPSEIVTPSLTDMAKAPVATIHISGSEDGSALNTTLGIHFLEANASANYNVSVVLTEDNLVGEGTGWNQVNQYAGGGNGAMGGFESFPSSVPAAFWPYSHVGRALIGGYEGINAVVGEFGEGGFIEVDMSSFNMNPAWNTENMHVIAILTDSNGEILNARSETYADVLANSPLATVEIFDESIANIYPNPASSFANIDLDIEGSAEVNVEVIDVMGQLVSKRNLGNIAGRETVRFDVSDLATGTYLFKVIADQKVKTQKIAVVK